MRDELGFRFHADIAATDYLGWGEKGVAGYWGSPPPDTERGWTPPARDLNAPGSSGRLQKAPEPKAKRFSVSYHLLRVTSPPQRIRLQVWCDDGEPVPSVISVWPTADWHEREAWDMLGIAIEGHPNLSGSSWRTTGTATRSARTTRSAGRPVAPGFSDEDSMAVDHPQDRAAPSDLRGHPDPVARPDRVARTRPSTTRATSSRSTSGRTIPPRTASCGSCSS